MNDEDQAEKDELLKLIWEGANGYMTERWIEHELRKTEESPNAPFADAGAALKRLLDCGASRRDISLICRMVAYESSAQTLVDICEYEPCSEALGCLYENLIAFDPSGMEGRPGSAPGPKPPVLPGTP